MPPMISSDSATIKPIKIAMKPLMPFTDIRIPEIFTCRLAITPPIILKIKRKIATRLALAIVGTSGEPKTLAIPPTNKTKTELPNPKISPKTPKIVSTVRLI